MRRCAAWIAGVCALVLGAGVAPGAQGESPRSDEARAGDARLPGLAARLAALDASDAHACFDLAEEFVIEFDDEAGREMARTLFVLAHEADRRPGQHRGLTPHVYLALASIAREETERRMLLAMSANDSGLTSGASLGGTASAQTSLVPEGAFELAEAIGMARAGDARGVRDRVRRPGVRAALDGLGDDEAFIRSLLDDAERDGVCPTCKNKRVVRNQIPGEERESVDTLCPMCRGNPGPRLSRDQFARTLDVEARLLGTTASRWSAQHWLDRGRPFQDPDPSELAARYGVDPRRTRWTPGEGSPDDPFGGVWTSPR